MSICVDQWPIYTAILNLIKTAISESQGPISLDVEFVKINDLEKVKVILDVSLCGTDLSE